MFYQGFIKTIPYGLLFRNAFCVNFRTETRAEIRAEGGMGQFFVSRSGGKTFITFLFDSCFCWAVSIPAAYFLAHYTRVPILPMYAAVISCELVKVVIGITLVNKGIWIKNITV